MSWYVEAIVKTKEKAQELIEREQCIPPELKVAMLAQIAGLVQQSGVAIHLKTNGHFDPHGGNVEFRLGQIILVE